MLEMLLQSYRGELDLLPALPATWPKGRCQGLRGRGGYCVDLCWDGGALRRAEVRRVEAGTCTILHGVGRYRVLDSGGKPVVCEEEGHRLRFAVEKGRVYVVVPV